MGEKLKESWHMHIQLYRDIGDQLTYQSSEFNRFKLDIPLGERDKSENIKCAEDLLCVWENRGGIGVGNYEQLRQVLIRTNLLKVLRIADEQIDRIKNQLSDEEGTPGPAKDYLSSNRSSRIQEHLTKRKGSDDSQPQQCVAIQKKSTSQWSNLQTSHSQHAGAILDNSFSTPEPSDCEPRTTKIAPAIQPTWWQRVVAFCRWNRNDALRQNTDEQIVKRKGSESPPQQHSMTNLKQSTSQRRYPSTSQTASATLHTRFSTPQPSDCVPQQTRSSPTIHCALRQNTDEQIVKRKGSESPPQQHSMTNLKQSTSQRRYPSTSQTASATLHTRFSTPQPSDCVPQQTRSSPTIHCDQLHDIQCELRNWYIRTISRLHPIPWCEWLEQDLDHMFTNLEMVPGLKEQISQRSNSNCGDIQKLSRVFNSDLSERSVCLIEGPAGIGKSTLCRRFVHLWSKNKYSIDDHYFDIAFLLEARLLTGNLKTCIKEQLFPKDFRLSEDNIYDCLCNPQKKCLLIIDGVDELTAEGTTTVKELLNGDKLRDVNLLMTGRPEASKELVKDVNSHFKITGFSDENVKKYLCKYFTSKYKIVKDKLLARLVYDLHLRNIMKNPFTTLLVCSLAADNAGDIPVNLKDIIDEVLQSCCRKYINKNEASGINVLSQEQLLSAAGHLAYNGTKQGITAYPQETLASFCPDGFSEHLLKSGILSKDFTVSRLHPKSFCYFPHKSFQEFMCARHLTALHLRELEENISELLLRTLRTRVHTFTHGNIFRFLLGMLQCQDKTKVVLECLFMKLNISRRQIPLHDLEHLECLLNLLYEFDRREDLLEVLVQSISTSDRAINYISFISNYKIVHKKDFVYHEVEKRISIPLCQKIIQKMLLPPILVVWHYPTSPLHAEDIMLTLTFMFVMIYANFPLCNYLSVSEPIMFKSGIGLLRQISTYRPKLIDFALLRHRQLFVTGPSSLGDTGLLNISWSFIHCKSIKDANVILTKGVKMSVLTILLEPGNGPAIDITALIKALTSTKYKVHVLFLLVEDVLDDQHVLRMLSMFSSLHNISFIKIRCDVELTPAYGSIYLSKKYRHDCSIIQMYYSKCCPY